MISYIMLFYFFQLSPLGTTVFRGIRAFDLDADENKDINFGIFSLKVSLLMNITLLHEEVVFDKIITSSKEVKI